MRRLAIDALTGAALAFVAIVVGMYATRGGVDDWTVPLVVAGVSLVGYPLFARFGRRRRGA